jgi:hypothetical protein
MMHFAAKKVSPYVSKPQQQQQQQQLQQLPVAPPPPQPSGGGGFFSNLFSSAQPPLPIVSPPMPPPQPEVNTNILSIDLGSLSKEVKLFTGDPIVCISCESIFNTHSVLQPINEDGMQLWVCDFCGTQNHVRVEPEELPQKGEEIVDYMLSPPMDRSVSLDNKTIIFCIDISGSMCITSEIEGKHKFRFNRADQLQSLNEGGVDQWLPGQRRNISYISRLQCVQAAIESQLEALRITHPNARVGLVVFSNEVTIIGDGTQQPIVVAGDKLYNNEALLNVGQDCPPLKPLSESKDKLLKSITELSESGSTALGPAVMVSLGLLKNIPGSTIVLATDGLANAGVGAMDLDELMPVATQFYNDVSQLAKEKGIIINVVGIKGDTLHMLNLGKLSSVTSGVVELVDPLEIKDNFTSILQGHVVATNVMVKLFLHKGVKVPADADWIHHLGKLYVEKNVGNTFSDTEITAEFEFESEDTLVALLKQNKMCPFQVQVVYNSNTGMKCLRVISYAKEITLDKVEKQELDIPLLGIHANTKTAQMVQQGDIFNAQNTAQQYSSIMQEHVSNDEERKQYGDWATKNSNLIDVTKDMRPTLAGPPSSTSAWKPTYDSGMVSLYHQADYRKNKQQWSEKRKY